MAHEPPLGSLRSGDLLSEQSHAGRPRAPNGCRNEQRGTAIGHQADLGECQHESRRLLHHLLIAGERKRNTDASGNTVDRGDHRRGRLQDRHRQTIGRIQGVHGGLVAAHIGARAEGLAVAGQHNHASGRLIDLICNRVDEVCGEGIELVRAVQCESKDRTRVVDQQPVHVPSRVHHVGDRLAIDS